MAKEQSDGDADQAAKMKEPWRTLPRARAGFVRVGGPGEVFYVDHSLVSLLHVDTSAGEVHVHVMDSQYGRRILTDDAPMAILDAIECAKAGMDLESEDDPAGALEDEIINAKRAGGL